MRAMIAVFMAELKRTLTYRVEFWAGNFIQAAVHLYVAFSLWSVVFTEPGQVIGGYSFDALMFYYILSACLYYVICPGEMGFISSEIYEGQLNRYLVYPAEYLPLKFAVSLAQSALYAGQFVLVLILFRLIFGEIPIPGLMDVVIGLLACVVSMALSFICIAILQLAAFWIDQCWTLVVMFYMLLAFLGGRTLPLEMLPTQLKNILSLTPFPLIIAFPTEAFLGRLSQAQLLERLCLGTFWIGILWFAMNVVYERGLKRYGGVGI